MTTEGAVWIAIVGSLAMGIAAALVFVLSVKRRLFDDLEDAKYQVFWSDHDDPAVSTREGDSAHASHSHP